MVSHDCGTIPLGLCDSRLPHFHHALDVSLHYVLLFPWARKMFPAFFALTKKGMSIE